MKNLTSHLHLASYPQKTQVTHPGQNNKLCQPDADQVFGWLVWPACLATLAGLAGWLVWLAWQADLAGKNGWLACPAGWLGWVGWLGHEKPA